MIDFFTVLPVVLVLIFTGIFAGVLAAGAVTRFVKGAIDSADSFGKLSVQTGIAANSLQAYVNAGKIAGIEQATIDLSLIHI